MNREYIGILEIENAELKQENKKLNGTIQTYDILLKSNVEENKQLKDNYCNRTDCTGRIKDSKKYKSIQGRVEELENTLREIQKYCNYLHNNRKYNLNDGHIRKIRNICKRELEKNKEIKNGD